MNAAARLRFVPPEDGRSIAALDCDPFEVPKSGENNEVLFAHRLDAESIAARVASALNRAP